MKKELNIEQALIKAADMCRRVERCEADVRSKIQEWGISETDINKIIKRLKDDKFIDDARFCSLSVKRGLKINKWGRIKIAYHLKVKKLQEKHIQQALKEIEDDEYVEILENMLKSKESILKYKNKYEHRSKLYTFALSHGFEPDYINEALKAFKFE